MRVAENRSFHFNNGPIAAPASSTRHIDISCKVFTGDYNTAIVFLMTVFISDYAVITLECY